MWNPPNPTQFNQQVWTIVRSIPEGQVMTYGQIASMLEPPIGVEPEDFRRLSPRWVGSAMRAVNDRSIPWQRVINSKGMISLPSGSSGAERQRQLLEMEGIVFDEKDRVDLDIYGWKPET